MRVLFPNGNIAYPPSKGPHIHKYQLTRNLSALGYQITTFSADQNPHVYHVPKRPLSVLRTLRATEVLYVRTGEGASPATRLTSPLFQRLIPETAAVVWEMNLDPGLQVRRIPRTDRQVARDLRDLRNQARRVDAAICVTPAIAEQAREVLGIERTFTVQNGSDPEMFRPDLPRMNFEDGDMLPRSLNIAWIPSESNAIHHTALVVDLARRIDQQQLPLKVHVMGDNSTVLPVPMPRSMILHGPVSYFDLPRYLSSMDVGLVLYNIRYDGGSPLKLFDYCASGCVPFCTPGQGIEEVLTGSGAGYVQNWTAESLCGAIEALRRNPEKLQSMAKKGRNLVEDRYNWKAVASRIDDIIRECVGHRS